MITYNQQIEVSLFLDADGIELYFNDDSEPSGKFSVEYLINDFLDSRSEGNIFSDIKDIQSVRNSLQQAIEQLDAALAAK